MSVTTPDPGADPAPAGDRPAPKAGDRIGSYRLVKLLGEGATGRVFEVEHLTIGRRAAMKILAPDHAARPGAIKRLFSEARAVNKMSHPHIVEVTDLIDAEQSSGVNAIVMELLEGHSLGEVMAASPGGIRMGPERFLPILSQVADALSAAHGARFVHRDLKPENIFLTGKGGGDYVKLLDFGLAKSVATAREMDPAAVAAHVRSHATAEGTFVGTPAYASPEQAAGKAVDHRTDIYSLGVITFELLTGHLPFEGKNFGEYLVKHLTQPPPPAPPEVLRTPMGRVLDAIARKCMAKDPGQRFASAAELRSLFDAVARGEPVSVPGMVPAPLSLITSRLARVPRWALVGGGALVLGVAIGGLLMRGPGSASAPQRVKPASGVPAAAALGQPSFEPLPPPKRLLLRFESEPPGAETRRVGESQLLGVTPFHQTFRADGTEATFEMRLAGHQTRRDTVTLSQDASIGGPLRALAAGPGAGRPGAKRAQPGQKSGKPGQKSGKNATLNPFSR